MDTRFDVQFPGPADVHESALAAQVIVLIQEPTSRAALGGTLRAVTAAPVARRVLVAETQPDDRTSAGFDGQRGAGAQPDNGTPAGFDVLGPRGADPADRMSAAFADAYATSPLPMLLVAAASPQVTGDLLADAAHALMSGEADAVFGPLTDGGCWLLGLRRPDRSLLVGTPGYGPGIAGLLLDRLASAGLRVALAPRLPAPAELRF